MDLQTATRLVWLVREYKKTLARSHSLARRVVRLLDACPDDTALRETTLDALEGALDQLCNDANVMMLAAREQCERYDPDDVDSADAVTQYGQHGWTIEDDDEDD